MKKVIGGILTVILCFSIWSNTIHAQSVNYGLSIAITPSINELTVASGKKTVKDILVKNDTANLLTVSIFTQDFYTSGSNGELRFYSQSNATFDPSSWFSTPYTFVSIEPFSHKEVPVTINIPYNAEPGGYYVAEFFQQQNTYASGQALNVSAKIGSLFFLTVPGDIQTKANISGVSLIDHSRIKLPGGIIGSSNISFEVNVKNSGNVHASPNGVVKIYNLFGALVDTSTLEQHIILPNTTRVMQGSWSNKNNILIGTYHATAEITYNDNGVIKHSYYHFGFSAFPEVQLVEVGPFVLLILILGIILVWKAFTKPKRRGPQKLKIQYLR
jgi:hypothetical protein